MPLFVKLKPEVADAERKYDSDFSKQDILVSFYKKFSTQLASRFHFNDIGWSAWKYATSSAEGGERMSVKTMTMEDIFNTYRDAIVKVDGVLSFDGNSLPVVIEMSADREFSEIYEDVSLNASIDSEFEDLCDFLDSLDSKAYSDFVKSFYELLSEIDEELTEELRREVGTNPKSMIKYAYVSRFPVDRDVTEYYFLYYPRKTDPQKELLELTLYTASQNREEEPVSDTIIKARENTVFRNRNVVSFLSGINEVRSAVDKIMKRGNIVTDTSHSTLIVFSRNTEERRQVYRMLKENLLLRFISVLPERSALVEAAKKIATGQEDLPKYE